MRGCGHAFCFMWGMLKPHHPLWPPNLITECLLLLLSQCILSFRSKSKGRRFWKSIVQVVLECGTASNVCTYGWRASRVILIDSRQCMELLEKRSSSLAYTYYAVRILLWFCRKSASYGSAFWYNWANMLLTFLYSVSILLQESADLLL